MTTKHLKCSCGHSWEYFGAAPMPADLRSICPICTVRGEMTLDASESSGPAAADSPLALPAGLVVAGFEILEEISRGGMGVIYKARQQGLNRLVALKVIAQQRLGQDEAIKRFRREVQAAALLCHPNIVTVFHTDLEGPSPYLAMEYLEGIDLLKLVRKAGPLPIIDAVAYVLQAAHGLQHAHEQGLVHRDIKPANLMVTPSPLESVGPKRAKTRNVKILDMGLARLTMSVDDGNDTSGLTQAGEFLGTPDFIAPEQAEDSRKADIRSDLYSLGGTLYFLLTGEVPFPGGSVIQKLRRQLTEAPPSPAARRPDLPAAVDAIVRRLMTTNPAARFQTPDDLIDALEVVRRDPGPAPLGPATRTAPVNPPSRPSPTEKVLAHPGGVQSVSISSDGRLLLTGGLDQTLRLWETGRLQETLCIDDKVGSVDQACIAPAGKWAASCALRLMQKFIVVDLWDLATGKVSRRLKGLADTGRCVCVSPDGRRVAAAGDDPTIRIWSVDQAGSPSIALKGHTDQVNCVVFLPAGDSLLSGSNDGTLRLWDVKTGAVKGTIAAQVGKVAAVAFGGPSRRLAVAGQGLRIRQADASFTVLFGSQTPVLSVAFSPDGQTVASGGADHSVRLWRAADGEQIQCFTGHTDKVRAVVFSPDGKTVYSGSADGHLRRWPLG